jgi:hypothetical protein
MKTLARKKIAPIGVPTPEADTDTSRLWTVETPTGREEVYADDCDIRHGVLQFIDAPFGVDDGRRVHVCSYSPSGWTRLIPPPPDFDADDEAMHEAGVYATACANVAAARDARS